MSTALGYVAILDNGTPLWQKIYHGNPAEGDRVESIPWVKYSFRSQGNNPVNERDNINFAFLLKL